MTGQAQGAFGLHAAFARRARGLTPVAELDSDIKHLKAKFRHRQSSVRTTL
jgi:hypothetical protein